MKSPLPLLPLSFTPQQACAIVVTYHPDAAVPRNLAALRAQVGGLIVVDNGSPADAITLLEQASRDLGFRLILNHENLGVATALNIGATEAARLGFLCFFFFDQDSCVTDSFTSHMLAAHAAFSTRRLGMLVPRYLDSRTGQPLPNSRLPDGCLAYAITSGSLLSAATFDASGPFADELFIDSVDHEYSLRLRRAGYCIASCESATLLHSLGTPRQHSILGFRFQSTNYSPIRRYYQERNKVWMYRRYATSFPGFCLRELLQSFANLTKVLLVEHDRRAKVRFFFRGIADGLRGRMGKL